MLFFHLTCQVFLEFVSSRVRQLRASGALVFLVLISAAFLGLCQPAEAQSVKRLWFDGYSNTSPHNEDPVALCKSINVSTSSGLYYNGAYFDPGLSGLSGPTQTSYICRDVYYPLSNLHQYTITLRCATLDSAGNVTSVASGASVCTLVPAPSSCSKIGDPTDISTMSQVEHLVDWRSSRDPRFVLDRYFNSDPGSFSRIVYPTYATGMMSLGGVWRSGFDQSLTNYGGDPMNYRPADGRIIVMPTVNSATATKAGFPYSLKKPSGSVPTYWVEDGTGKRMRFDIFPGRAVYALMQITWSDGYVITITRNTSNFSIQSISDNRGQRANFTTSTVPGNTTNVFATKIEIDTNYNGTTFAPEVELNYAYAANPTAPGWPMITSVTRRDVITNVTEGIGSYSYYDTTKYFPPLLLSASDGRVDASGNPVVFSSFSYRIPGMTGSVTTSNPIGTVLNSSRAGGDLLHSFTVPVAITQTQQVVATNPLGLQTTYTYEAIDGVRMLTQIDGAATANCLATTKSLGYVPNSGAPLGFVYSRTDRNGAITSYARDARGLVLTQTEDVLGANPRVTSNTWHATLRLPLTRTTDGLLETFTYTSEGLLLTYAQKDTKAGSPTLNQVRTWTYSYTTLASGLKVLTTLDGPGLSAGGINDVTTYTYTANGDLATVTDPNGLVTTVLARNDQGQPTQIEQPDKYVWTFTYDQMGRMLTSAFNPPGQTPAPASFGYDVAGQMTSYTDSLGHVWTFTYNDARRLMKTVAPSGDTAGFTYDAAGNVTKTEYSNGTGPVTFWEQTQFDELSRLLKMIGAQGQQWAYTHDVEDNLSTETDPQTKVDTFGFDALNRMISVVDRESYTTALAYDAHDRETSFTDPRSIATTFVYNGFGETISEVSADRGTTGYSYDQRGLVSAMTDGRGVTVNYTYDNGGRLTLIDYPPGGLPDQVFTYDTSFGTTPPNAQKGKVARISDGVIQTTFGTEPVSPSGIRTTYTAVYPASRTYAMSDETNLAGQKTRTVYPSGSEVLYLYDLDGRVSRVQFKVGSTITTLADAITYAPNGPITGMVFGDTASETRSYDTSYRLTGITDLLGATALRQVSYGYDARDDLTAVTDALVPANSEGFTYTPRESLATATGPYGTMAFTYDGVGNRISHAVNPGSGLVTDSYAYPPTSNRLGTITLGAGGSRVYNYDAMGNVTADSRSGANHGYGYDSAGRMATFSIGGVSQATYTYDFAGRQAIRSLTSPTPVTIHSVFDSEDRRIAEYDEATGTLIREYVWLGWEPLAVIEGGQIYFVHTDHIGRPVFATDGSGAKVWTMAYSPFGGITTSTGVPANMRFPGQWYQAESGLYQNWMRDYDPTTGRYLQADPLGLVDGASVYGYARQNPTRHTDPTGKFGVDTAIEGAIGGIELGGAIAGGAIAGAIAIIITPSQLGDGTLSQSVIDAQAKVQEEEDCNRTDCSKATSFQIRSAGIADEHSFKEEWVGRPVSRWDICACKDGRIVIRLVGKCGVSGPTVVTTEWWK